MKRNPMVTDNPTVKALLKSNVARYIQLASLFRQKISYGTWGVGEKIPTVKELADECGVATMTIRQALDIIESEGLIERYRAKGTFVKDAPKQNLWCDVNTDFSGMLIARQDANIEVLSDTQADKLPTHEEALGKPAAIYRHLTRRHSRDGTAFLFANVYLDEDIRPLIPEESYTSVTSMRLISDLPGQTISGAKQVVTIGAADLETSTQLNIPIGHPVAHVQRTAVNQHGTIILLANGVYRGDLIKIEFNLQ